MIKTTSKKTFVMVIVGFILSFYSDAWTKTTVNIGTDVRKNIIIGKIVTPDEVVDGKLIIEDDVITCVGNSCAEPSDAFVYTVTEAYIFPGFIDAHNHVAYNVLPKWTPPKVYKNRGQWQASNSYKIFKKPYDELKGKGLFCEMVKYGEVKSLISGITTIQGTAPDRKCYKMLVRNAENKCNLEVSSTHIRTYILDINGLDTQKYKIDFDETKSFVVHIGEGIDERSRKEFDTLKEKGLLAKETAIIHGTAFSEKEFKDMGQIGAKLIWSPQSNLALYQKTTNVKLAIQNGVLVSLGIDWNLSGSDTIFDELRVAEKVNSEEFGGIIPESDWIKMVTINPAKALALENYVGSLKAGLKADITVLSSKDSDCSKSLLRNKLEDVEMVWVGGNLLYGNEDVVRKVKGDCEELIVHGSRKQVCVSDPTLDVEKAGQTLADIKSLLLEAYPWLAVLAP